MRPFTDPTRAPGANSGPEARVVALDGFRGLMTVFVVLSHYFGEVPGGYRLAATGWLAVDAFFVLSGYLVGKLIIEKKHHANFLQVFYLRRVCRTFPIYFTCVLLTLGLLALADPRWAAAEPALPAWSYLTFTHTFFMVSGGTVGAHWLGPTWTMAVEEHFYLVAPALFFLVPRRWIVPVLVAGILGAVAFRASAYLAASPPVMAALVLLPGRADGLICGILAAVAVTTPGLRLERFDQAFRIVPILALVLVFGLHALDRTGVAFGIVGHLAVSVGCACFILSLVRGAPEATRFRSRLLLFFGHNSFAIYLTHLPILGLAHGLVLGTTPDVATPAQWAVTLATLPVCALVGRLLTRLVEEPVTAFGRSFAWSKAARGAPVPALQAAPTT